MSGREAQSKPTRGPGDASRGGKPHAAGSRLFTTAIAPLSSTRGAPAPAAPREQGRQPPIRADQAPLHVVLPTAADDLAAVSKNSGAAAAREGSHVVISDARVVARALGKGKPSVVSHHDDPSEADVKPARKGRGKFESGKPSPAPTVVLAGSRDIGGRGAHDPDPFEDPDYNRAAVPLAVPAAAAPMTYGKPHTPARSGVVKRGGHGPRGGHTAGGTHYNSSPPAAPVQAPAVDVQLALPHADAKPDARGRGVGAPSHGERSEQHPVAVTNVSSVDDGAQGASLASKASASSSSVTASTKTAHPQSSQWGDLPPAVRDGTAMLILYCSAALLAPNPFNGRTWIVNGDGGAMMSRHGLIGLC